MTLEEIELMVIEDYKMPLAVRLFNKMNPHPEPPKKVAHDFDYIEWTVSQFSDEQLENELVSYKEELIIEENERLRKTDLIDRFEKLKDMRKTFHNKHPDTPNPAVWLRDLLNQSDKEGAESKMVELENKDIELSPTQEDIDKEQWVKDIENELKIEGLTKDGLLEALVRKVILEDGSLAEIIKPKLIKVNTKKPRP